MNILSFTYWIGCHDTSAAIVCDGQLIAAAEEERFSRRKHDGGFPFRAVEFCLRQAGITMEQVDVIAFPDKPFRSGPDSQIADMDVGLCRRLYEEGVLRRRSLIHKRLLDASLHLALSHNWSMHPTVAQGFALLRQRYSKVPPVRYYEHHLAHAAAAYFTSDFERAAIVTMDGRGGSYASVTWKAEGSRISRTRAEPFTNSLGQFYGQCTHYLGLGRWGEGKTMGLASYGDRGVYASKVSSLVDFPPASWYDHHGSMGEKVLGFPARQDEPIVESPFPDFAAACQESVERSVMRVVASAIQDAKSRNVCMGGGVMLNCSSNGALMASDVADSISVFPAAGDNGLSTGAALLCAQELGELNREGLANDYWGPGFSDAEHERALQGEPRVVYHRSPDIAREVAGALAGKKVVGWFQGRMELGPRALGNRSILADPRTTEIRDRVNRLKGREWWRPLAPVVLAEHASEYFTLKGPSPFMLFAAQVRPEMRSRVPAIVHIDGSARPQTLRRDQNPQLYNLLLAFQRLTDIPMLLNTSFNVAGEPIVCTPEDSIRSFLAAKLDMLVLGDYVVSRRGSDD
jgi:carbamoyltransferase